MAVAARRPRRSAPPFRVHELTLANGLQVRLVRNPATPAATLYTFFRVGSRNERPGITGISHLFEHMMFNGAKRYGPKEFDQVLESNGGRCNAYTSTDFTVYYDDFAKPALQKVLDLESDRMGSLTLSEATLTSEREVVKEERRLRVDNEVLGLMDEELASLVYRAHPYRWPVIGWMKDIESISRQDCEAFFRTFYAPNNALLYLVGDIDVDATATLIQRYYGLIRRGPPAPGVVDSEPVQLGERRSEIHYPAQAPSLMFGYRGPPARDPQTLALDVLQYALSVGEGSRLVRELVFRKQLLVSVGLDWAWRIDPGLILLHAELKPGADVERVERALAQELDRVLHQLLPDRELTRAKNNLTAHLWRELATNNGCGHSLGTHEVFGGSWRYTFEALERYQAVTAREVRDAARRYLAPHQRSVVTLVPRKSA